MNAKLLLSGQGCFPELSMVYCKVKNDTLKGLQLPFLFKANLSAGVLGILNLHNLRRWVSLSQFGLKVQFSAARRARKVS